MKKAICRYSFHRRYGAESWTPLRLAEEVAALDIEGMDFHAGLLGSVDGADEQILSAVEQTHRTLSGQSLSNNCNQAEADELEKQIETVKQRAGGSDLRV